MTAHAAKAEPGRRFALWTVCVLVVAGIHGAALLTFYKRPELSPGVIAPPAVLLDLAPPSTPAPPTPALPTPAPPAPAPPAPPEPVAPTPEPIPPHTPEPPPTTAQPAPADIPPPPPEPKPAPLEPEVPLPRPVPRKPSKPMPRPHRAEVQPAAPPAMPSAPVAAPPAPLPAAPSPHARVSWESTVAAWLARFKHYPPSAQKRGEQGTALVRFSVDHAGMVHAITLAHGSGHLDLDREAQSLLERAQPLPPPPSDRPETTVDLQVPIEFSLR